MLGLGEWVGDIELYFKAVPFHLYLQASLVLSNSVLTGTADKETVFLCRTCRNTNPPKTIKYSEKHRSLIGDQCTNPFKPQGPDPDIAESDVKKKFNLVSGTYINNTLLFPLHPMGLLWPSLSTEHRERGALSLRLVFL